MTKSEKEGNYRVEISGEGVRVNKSIPEQVARQVLVLVMGATDIVRTGTVNTGTEEAGGVVSPKFFMVTKKPISDVEKITCLAYYLTHHRSVSEFKTKELTDLNREAKQPNFSNSAVAARNAVQQKYLELVGRGKKQITTRGEAVIEALPDREKVKIALSENRVQKRRRNKGKGRREKVNRN